MKKLLFLLLIVTLFSCKQSYVEEIYSSYWHSEKGENENIVLFQKDYHIQFIRPSYYPNNENTIVKKFNPLDSSTTEIRTNDYWIVSPLNSFHIENSDSKDYKFGMNINCNQDEILYTAYIQMINKDEINISWNGSKDKFEYKKIDLLPFHFDVNEVILLIDFQSHNIESTYIEFLEPCISDTLMYWGSMEGYNTIVSRKNVGLNTNKSRR